ncbi:MAG TPA: hypothetical protein VEL07_18715 [Planctomycetota bacterium]|nr:hypothetical protein [Planctomycetota bacterium]
MTEPRLTIAVFTSDGHDPIYVTETPQVIRVITMRIRMSWELYRPLEPGHQSLASQSLAIGGMLVNPKHITRVAFVNEVHEFVAPPIGFDLGA